MASVPPVWIDVVKIDAVWIDVGWIGIVEDLIDLGRSAREISRCQRPWERPAGIERLRRAPPGVSHTW